MEDMQSIQWKQEFNLKILMFKIYFKYLLVILVVCTEGVKEYLHSQIQFSSHINFPAHIMAASAKVGEGLMTP